METIRITAVLRSDRDLAELRKVVRDLFVDLSKGFLGDPSDWDTFEVLDVE